MTHSLNIFDIFHRLDVNLDFEYIKKYSYMEKKYRSKLGWPKNERIILFFLIDLILDSNDSAYIHNQLEIFLCQTIRKKSSIMNFIQQQGVKKIISFGFKYKYKYRNYSLNITWEYGHVRNDKKEFSKNPIRPLQKITQEGIKCIIEKSIPQGERILLDNYDLRIVNINGFKKSKLSLLVHDYFDHVLFSQFCISYWVFDRHKLFLWELGYCFNYDIFSRESEMISSLAYEIREFLLQGASLSYKNNKKSLMQMFKSMGISSMELFKVDYIYKTWLNLYVIIVRILIELQEQTRKVGRIKLNTNEWIRNLKYIEKKYLLFIIDCVYLVSKNLHQFNNSIYSVYSLIESNLKNSVTQGYNSFVLSFPESHNNSLFFNVPYWNESRNRNQILESKLWKI